MNSQIGEYDIDYVVLNLGSEVNVMTKQTWALMVLTLCKFPEVVREEKNY